MAKIDLQAEIETARLNDPRHPERAESEVLRRRLQEALDRIEALECQRELEPFRGLTES